MSSRPNFLFLITDQQRADTLGCYGGVECRTPNIDRLAAAGWASDAFHVASPICMPNRSTLMTGLMPSVHGVRHNGIPLDLGARTFVRTLAEAGYRTMHVGKSHLQNIQAKPPLYPAGGAPGETGIRTPGRYDQELGPRWEADPRHDVSTPFYGFQSVDLTVDHGDAVQGHYRRWLRERSADAEALLGDAHALPAPDYELTRIHQAWRTRIPPALHPTAFTAERAIERMREAAAAGQPFFLHCSFADPHHPMTPPGQYWDMYKPEHVTLPHSFHAEHTDLPPTVRWLYAMRDSGKAVRNTPALFAVSEREAREARALTYGLTTFIDDQVGRILGALDALGLAENTVVVYTSDHGEYLGDHQLFLKGPVHYGSLLRTAFLWRDPQGPRGARSSALLSTLDIAPTILARAGLPVPHGMQGQPFWAHLRGEAPPARDALLVEEEGQRVYLGFERRVRMRSLVTRQHRLSVYEGADWGELYDLEADPHELRNLWNAPHAQALRARLLQRLVQSIVEHAATSPAPTQIA